MSDPAVTKDAITTAKFSLLIFSWGKVLGGRNMAVVENRLCRNYQVRYKFWVRFVWKATFGTDL